MSKNYSTLLLVLFIVAMNTGCSKKKGCTDPISINYNADAEEDDGTCAYAGLGGNTTIVAKPEHHTMPIVGQPGYPDSAFIKFNAIESPGTNPGAYDWIVAGEEGEDHVHLEGLKPGNYYIMMTGMDTMIHERVMGGLRVVLSQASGEVVVKIPVTE